MRAVRFNQTAVRDLQKIARYSEGEWGSVQKERTLDRIARACEMLIAFPHLGIESRVKGVYQRVVPKLPFILLYQITETDILIVQILHMRQDS